MIFQIAHKGWLSPVKTVLSQNRGPVNKVCCSSNLYALYFQNGKLEPW